MYFKFKNLITESTSQSAELVIHAVPHKSLLHSKLDYPVPGGYKYGDLSLQVGGVSNETVKYGREFCEASIQK
jgi:hypothetical protein